LSNRFRRLALKKTMGKKQIKVKFYRKKDLARNIESLIVEVNSDGSIEKRQFADEKAAYEYIETLKKEKS